MDEQGISKLLRMPEVVPFGDPRVLHARAELRSVQRELSRSLEAAGILESVLNASRDCIKVLTPAGQLVFANEAARTVMAVDEFESIHGKLWVGLWDGDAAEAAEKALEQARFGGTGTFQGYARAVKGRARFWDVIVTRIRPEGAGEDYILSISRDITAEKEVEASRKIVNAELMHRVKNTLAVAQAIAAQTFLGAAQDKFRKFAGRLSALATAQEVLVKGGPKHVNALNLIQQTLLPLCPPESLRLDVAECRLDGRRGLALALAVHELGTNSLKYGALSCEGGKVAIRLRTCEGRLSFAWQEIHGPPAFPPAKNGFGTKLTTRNLEAVFNGKVVRTFDQHGFRLELTAPA